MKETIHKVNPKNNELAATVTELEQLENKVLAGKERKVARKQNNFRPSTITVLAVLVVLAVLAVLVVIALALIVLVLLVVLRHTTPTSY